MSQLRVFEDDEKKNRTKLIEMIEDPKRICRIHPFQILKALLYYCPGSSLTYKTARQWPVDDVIRKALIEAFYLCLQRNTASCSGRKYCVCIDGSKSMLFPNFLGINTLTAAKASAAMAFALQHSNEDTKICICTEKMVVLGNTEADLIKRLDNIDLENEQKSDMSIPIKKACELKEDIDAFILFTTSDASNLCVSSPYDAFINYKEVTKRTTTKLIVCAMEVSTKVLADPNDDSVKILCGADAKLIEEITSFTK